MIQLIEQNRDSIVRLCEKYGVTRLELFGSAAHSDAFEPGRSDVDFLFTIDTLSPRLPDRFFGFHEDLEALLGCKVDLVDIGATTNPYFWQVANRSRVLLHAA